MALFGVLVPGRYRVWTDRPFLVGFIVRKQMRKCQLQRRPRGELGGTRENQNGLIRRLRLYRTLDGLMTLSRALYRPEGLIRPLRAL